MKIKKEEIKDSILEILKDTNTSNNKIYYKDLLKKVINSNKKYNEEDINLIFIELEQKDKYVRKWLIEDKEKPYCAITDDGKFYLKSTGGFTK